MDKGVPGLLAGFSCGIFLQFVSFFLILLCFNWQRISDEAVERIKKEEKELKKASKEVLSGMPSNDQEKEAYEMGNLQRLETAESCLPSEGNEHRNQICESEAN